MINKLIIILVLSFTSMAAISDESVCTLYPEACIYVPVPKIPDTTRPGPDQREITSPVTLEIVTWERSSPE